MPDSAEPLDEAGARRLVIRAVGALIAFVLAAGVAVVLNEADGDNVVSSDDGGTLADGERLFSGGAPLAGTEIPAYVVRRKTALARTEGRVVAAVSFAAYTTEAEARAKVEGTTVRALLVAAPGGGPSTVEGSLDRWAARERQEAEAEREGLVRMLTDTEDPDFVAQFQADIARLAGLLQGLDPNGPVVFGAVVEGDVAALRAVAGRPGVRLVDVVARRLGGDIDIERVGGIRPEETTRAGDPPHRPF